MALSPSEASTTEPPAKPSTSTGAPQVLPGSVTASRRLGRSGELQLLRRLDARRLRRQQGIVLRPSSAPEAAVDDAVVRLHGYAALRRVFPAAPKRQVLDALGAAEGAQVSQRPAIAARILLRSGTACPVAAPKVAEAPVMLNLLRTATAGPTIFRPQPRLAPAAPPTLAAPRLLSRCASIAEDGAAVAAAVPELRPWLEELGLGARFHEAARWVDDAGACDIDEVAENVELLADALALQPEERERCRGQAEAAARAAKSRMRPPVVVVRRVAVAVALPRATTAPPVFDPPAPAAAPEAPRQIRVVHMARDSQPPAAEEEEEIVGPDDVPKRIRDKIKEKLPLRPFYGDYVPRVHPVLMRAPIPAWSELHAVEIAEAAAKEAEEAAWADVAEEVAPGEKVRQLKVADPLGSMPALRRAFLNEYGDKIRAELGDAAKLVPAQTSGTVEQRFLQTCQVTGAMPDFGYHGTKQHNIPSILSRGLLVPGHHGVKVANGSAHGVGIYTAVPGGAGLSRTFCDSPDMLVCGVVTARPAGRHGVDGEKPAPQRHVGGHRNHHKPAAATASAPKMMGRFGVTRDDGVIRQVGQARVIFNESYVAPLFVAKGGGKRTIAHPAALVPKRFGPSGRINPVDPKRAGAGQVRIKGSGETVFEPPVASVGIAHDRHVKRVLHRKGRDRERQRAFDDKQAMLSGEDLQVCDA